MNEFLGTDTLEALVDTYGSDLTVELVGNADSDVVDVNLVLLGKSRELVVDEMLASYTWDDEGLLKAMKYQDELVQTYKLKSSIQM